MAAGTYSLVLKQQSEPNKVWVVQADRLVFVTEQVQKDWLLDIRQYNQRWRNHQCFRRKQRIIKARKGWFTQAPSRCFYYYSVALSTFTRLCSRHHHEPPEHFSSPQTGTLCTVCLSVPGLLHFNIMSSRCTHAVACARISFLFKVE